MIKTSFKKQKQHPKTYPTDKKPKNEIKQKRTTKSNPKQYHKTQNIKNKKRTTQQHPTPY